MIQFETVKYGILKPKDNQRNIKGDNTTVCSEEDVLLADTNSLTVESCHDRAFDDEQTVSSHPKEVLCKKNEILKMNCTGDMDTDESYHESEGDELERLNLNDGKISKHNEDAANNNGNHGDGEENGEEETDKSEQTDQLGDGGFAPGYFSLEALQKMTQFVSAAIANNSDNEDAQKQLAVLQTTLFTLQHQQLFQLQLIQQLQSQLSINRSDKDDEDVDEEDEREEGELTQEQMDEEQRRYEEEQRQIRKEEEESLKAKKDSVADKEKDGYQPLNPNLPIGPNDSISAMEASFSSSFASTIITNHDQPSSMDGLNSLEMLQKRAEEVLDSASRGILSGSLADEMSFKNDGKGRNEPFFKHRCRFCGKVFGSDSALQIHIRSHTGERPFKCNVCGSRFTTKGNLKVHFQRHTQKFPHINMNPHPIPEHLDKFYPPLLPPLPPGQQPPISPPPPQSSRPPAPMNLPFPPIPGLPPGLQGFQGIPGLPLFRPPFDLLKQMGTHPFFGAIRDAVHQEQRQEAQKQQAEEQVSPADLSKPPLTISPKIKDEPKEESVSPPPSEETQNSIEAKPNDEVNEKQKSRESPTALWKDNLRKDDCISPAKSIDSYSSPKDQPENLSKMSAKLSPSSVGSLRDSHTMDNQNEIKIFPSMMPRPGSTDNSWESYIEVDKSSETSKLQQLVDNIENKITDPNECCVCHKVLSCRSALQMHYRTHTGERPFRCKICGRAFTTKGNLKTHMSVHRMKPPMRTIHQCPVCHKKYSNSLVLQQHIRLHTGEPTDLTAEQIQAAEIRDFPSMSPGSFPMGLNPFAFPIPGMHPGSVGPESSIGENDDFMDEDFDDGSNFDENMSNAGSVSGDSTQNISNFSRANNEDNNHSRAISAMLAEHSKTTDNLSRAPSSASRAESVDDKSLSPRTPPQSSPAPSDISQGALDLTPRSEPKQSPPMIPQPHAGGLAGFPNFPFLPHVTTSSAPSMMNNAFSSLAQSVSPMGPFNPIALAGMRGNTTCKICLKTFACQSALEIHYRSHTKERPYKCSICDKAFTTKNEELIHTSLHFQIYGNMKQHMMTHKLRDMPPHMFGSTPQPIPQPDSPVRSPEQKEAPQIRIKSETELSPRSSDNSRGTTSSSNNDRSNSKRERSLPPQFQIQSENNYQIMMDRQHKSDSRLKRSQVENEQPIAKRTLVTESQLQEAISLNNKKDAFHMPSHPEEKTSSHLERLQQFHTSSLLNQPLKMDAHLKPTTSPGSDIGSGSGDQKHYCHLCQKNFSSTSSLQIHMRTHTGERPFVCNVCQKAFTTKGNLKVHMGIHTWSGASRRGRRMSLELPFNGSMPLMLQNPDFLQRHSDFFHPYPPTHLLGRMQQSMNMEQQKFERGAPPQPPILNLAHKYMNANGLSGLAGHPMSNHIDNRQPPYNSSPSPSSDKHTASPNSLRDDMLIDSPKRNGDLSPTRTATPDLSPRLWKLHYESKAVNRDNIDAKSDDQTKSVEELIA